MLFTPRAEPAENAATRAQRPEDFRFGRRRETRQCRSNAREAGGSLISKAKRGVHALAAKALGSDVDHRPRALFASWASTTCRKKEYG